MEPTTEPTITLDEAYQLMMVLDNDIPSWEKSKIAMTLLILVANPSMIKIGESVVVGKHTKPFTCRRIYYADDDDDQGQWFCD